MFSNDIERKIYLGILVAVIALIGIVGTALYIIRRRDRKRLLRAACANRTNNTANTTRTWWPFTRAPAPDVEKAKPTISLPAAFRPLHLAEQIAVESSKKGTYAQSQRNAMERAGSQRDSIERVKSQRNDMERVKSQQNEMERTESPRIFGEVGEGEVERPVRKWKRRNPDGTIG
ncbi:hypothetical protein BU23DRAFT_560781 [Bimuria novae-zelandiae CBS 107.79]|uniref:Uncharacterized protein n=1 Tax=Bimuria novae-zelandiae CBS 107.79 TaxID=1447943 RepID=A0A6A5ULK3_9PLEO|nr:hypothetical protein BU23DRAFT_560781 [Bimuria novae-zelandiae CBS 107.79]